MSRASALCRACRFPSHGIGECEQCGESFERSRAAQLCCSGPCASRRNARVREQLTGPRNPKYNGGLSFNTVLGRWVIVCRDGSQVYFARAVMQAHLGRALADNEHVHHINRDKTDDGIENLQVVSNEEHAHMHTEDRNAARREWLRHQREAVAA